jgi:L-lactate dehydrogenase complex protein LldG
MVAQAIVTSARDEILGRIRAALSDVPPDERARDVPVARGYRRHGELTGEALVERFADRVRDYDAQVRRVAPAGVAEAIGAACSDLGLRRIVVPPGLPTEWRPAELDVVEDDGLTVHQIDEINGALTGCALAIAETGTLVLDGQARSGRRLITLVPDHHVCVVTADQIRDLVPEAVEALAPPVRAHGVPVTLVSGPSASSDIELLRVEGVHGPRHLTVVIAG